MSSSLSFGLLLCVLFSLSVSVIADTACTVGGTDYRCPSLLSVLDRWGVEYRRYDTQRLMGYDGFYPGRKLTPNILITQDIPIIMSYFQGNNTNSTKIPLTMPMAVEIIDLPQYNYSEYIAFLFLPTAIINGPLPLPYDYNLVPSYLLAPGAINPIVLSFAYAGLPPDDTINTNFDKLKTICADHDQDIVPYHFIFATYNSRDPLYQSEVWVFPADSEYSKMRKQQVLEKLQKQGVDISAE